MNEFRIKKFKCNEDDRYCNKKLNQYIDERNQLINILKPPEINRESKQKKLNERMIRTQKRRETPNPKQTSQLNGTTRRAKKKIKENQEKRKS